MGARPGLGITTPRAMPPYKYATAVRNTQPQVVQPITLQQVCVSRTVRPSNAIITQVIPVLLDSVQIYNNALIPIHVIFILKPHSQRPVLSIAGVHMYWPPFGINTAVALVLQKFHVV